MPRAPSLGLGWENQDRVHVLRLAGRLWSSADGEILHEAATENNVPMIGFLVVEANTDVNSKDTKV